MRADRLFVMISIPNFSIDYEVDPLSHAISKYGTHLVDDSAVRAE